ncbi:MULTISPECIES: ComF family protein [unclassified Carboxylicivirga]|uniref:ComF family protein n=1 Tax=Carboxylicivirga TaxID=1628153 RepID=UPI003D340BA3
MFALKPYIASFSGILSSLFFPKVCVNCGGHLFDHEEEICGICIRQLPRTHFEKSPHDNAMTILMWGRSRIERAYSLFYYRKGERVQQLLHEIKYRGNQRLGLALGHQLGKAIRRSKQVDYDYIIPIPLHPDKQRKRGFNQAEVIAEGMAEVLAVETSTQHVFRKKYTSTQTRKGRFERWVNVADIFTVENEQDLLGKHLLLIDDVITTGATMEACINTLKRTEGVKISIATLATAVL